MEHSWSRWSLNCNVTIRMEAQVGSDGRGDDYLVAASDAGCWQDTIAMYRGTLLSRVSCLPFLKGDSYRTSCCCMLPNQGAAGGLGITFKSKVHGSPTLIQPRADPLLHVSYWASAEYT